MNYLFFSLYLHLQICFVVSLNAVSCALGFTPPTYFQLALGAISIFNGIGKETSSMKKTITKAVGAVAAGPKESSPESD